MFRKRNLLVIGLLLVFILLVGGSVLADDGRINLAPYHFGGDTLFCNNVNGCTLLDKVGKNLVNWPQAAVADAFAAYDKSGQNTQVGQDGQGTYGVIQLWAVGPDAETGKHKLCLIGYDEWGKQNSMCFLVNKDFVYERAPIGIGNDSCSWNLVALHATWNDGDGNFYETGWVIAQITAQGQIVVDSLYWMDTDPGYKACPWSEK